MWDPVAALLLAGPMRAKHVFVEGQQVVRDGRIVTLDQDTLAAQALRLAARLAG